MKWINYIPLFRLVIPFSLGIILCFYFPYSFSNIQYTLLLTFALAFVFFLNHHASLHSSFNFRWVFGMHIIFLFFFLGYIYANARIEKFQSSHYLQGKQSFTPISSYLATVVSEPESKTNSIKAVLEINQYRSNNRWINSTGKVLAYFKLEGTAQIKYGDHILFKRRPVEILPPANFDEFNYKKYLAHHHIYERIYLNTSSYKQVRFSQQYILKNKAITWRNWLIERYRTYGISGEELAIVSALTLGQKESLTNELKSAYASAGAMHVLAVSGLHVGIIYLVLKFLLGWMNRFTYGKLISTILLIISMWFYAVITGLSPSVIRAVTMFTFMIFAQTIKRKSNIYNTIALSAIAILLYDPFMLLEVGFQLSYLAVIGIVYLHSYLYKLLYFKTWILDKAWEITCVSLAAQIATAPLGILYFHQFPSYFLFSNFLIIPAAFVIIFLGLGFQLVAFIPLFGKLLSWCLWHTVWILNFLVRKLEVLPYSLISGLDITVYETGVMYLIILTISIWLTLYKARFFIYSLALTLILVTSQTIEKYHQINQKEITFYSTGKYTLIQLNIGLKQHLWGPKKLISDTGKMQFYVWHHDWKRGLKKPNSKMCLHQQVYQNLLWWGNTKILILTNTLPLKPDVVERFQPDIIYINTYQLSKQLLLGTNLRNKTIIIGTNTPKKIQLYTQQICDSLKIPYYSIRNNGSIKIALNKDLKPLMVTHQRPR